MSIRLFLLIALLWPASLMAQRISLARVPAPVQAAFAKNYATAQNVVWDKEGISYEASFRQNSTDFSAVFDASGQQTETEVSISPNKLPASAQTYMSQHKHKIKETAQITDVKTGKIYYEAEAGRKDYLFDEQGRVVQKIGQ
jgi:hypothetical protein